MRSTITLEPDVQRLIERAMARNKAGFKETVNSAIRKGLAVQKTVKVEFDLPVFRLGLLPGLDPQGLNALSDDALVEDAVGKLRRSA